MTSFDLLTSAWDWELSVIIGCTALGLAYLLFARPLRALETAFFFMGVTLLLLALVSPVDVLADKYLFSAHAVQHLLLAMVIPPLVVLGIPRRPVERALENQTVGKIERTLANPAVAWPAGVVPMIAWHVPALFNAALSNGALHIFEHLSFLVTGVIFWWPVIGPLDERRPSPLASIAYLFSACTACSILGAAITFAPLGAYPAYANAGTADQIRRLIRDGWGLDPKSDQQLGGMLLWVPGCLIYLTAILATVARWFQSERAEVTP